MTVNRILAKMVGHAQTKSTDILANAKRAGLEITVNVSEI